MDLFDEKSRAALREQKFFELAQTDTSFNDLNVSIDDFKRIYHFLEKNKAQIFRQSTKFVENIVKETIEKNPDVFSLEKIINFGAYNETQVGAHELIKAEKAWLQKQYNGAVVMGSRFADSPQRRVSIIIDDLSISEIIKLAEEIIPHVRTFNPDNSCSLFLVKSNYYRMTLRWMMSEEKPKVFSLSCVERYTNAGTLEACCTEAYNLEYNVDE